MHRAFPVLSLAVLLAACGDRSAAPNSPTETAPPPPAAADPAPPAADGSPTGGPTAGDGQPLGATAELKATQGNGVSGTLMLQPSGPGVQITGTISGLAPGSTHGFHVHENGDCSAPDASSAGEHYNPSGQPHGDPATVNRHLGDMPNVTADDQGAAQLTANIGGLSLRTGQPNDIVGRSIVIHEKADDYKTQPSGNSGKRIGCAIIK